MQDATNNRRWTDALNDEDLAFLRRFLLASGSLKEVAQNYDVSYPTVRLRLDRLIQKVQILEDATAGDEHERLMRALAAEGHFDTQTLKSLLKSYRSLNGDKPSNSST